MKHYEKHILLVGLAVIACGDGGTITDNTNGDRDTVTDTMDDTVSDSSSERAKDTSTETDANADSETFAPDPPPDATDTSAIVETDSEGVDAPACTSALGDIDESRFDQTNNRFTVQLWDLEPADVWQGIIYGSVYNGPNLRFNTERERSGFCRLLTYEGEACGDSCNAPKICIDGACQLPPSLRSVGNVMVHTSTGLQATLPPNAVGEYSWSADTTFFVGVLEWVTLEIPELGEGVTLSTCIPSPMVPESDFDELFRARAEGEDVTLRWTPEVAGARVYLHMTTCIATHGGISPVEIECEGPDQGLLTIPGSFLDAISTCPGCWGRGQCGSHQLVRYRAEEAEAGDTLIQLRGAIDHPVYFYPNR